MRPELRIAYGVLTIFLGGATAGAVAGMDAGGSIDGFYSSPPASYYRTRTTAPEPSSGWDGSTSATYAASGPLNVIDDVEIDRDGLPLYAPFDVRSAVGSAPVRVHRTSTTARADDGSNFLEHEVPRDDFAEDGRVDPPLLSDASLPANP